MNEPVRSLATVPDLTEYGITGATDILYNPSFEQLFDEETADGLEGYERGVLTSTGAIAVDTGKFTGRSPKDKYIVKDDVTRDTLWWASDTANNDNKSIDQAVWNDLRSTVVNQLSGKRLFVVDTFCGANKDTRIAVRFVMEVAWQAHFVTNMFVRPSEEELADYTPDFVVLNGAKTVNADWQKHGLNSENFVAFNLTEKMQLIGGSWYGGEMKKGMFGLMNYLLPYVVSRQCIVLQMLVKMVIQLYFLACLVLVKQRFPLIASDVLLVTMSMVGMMMACLTLRVVVMPKP